MFAADFPHRFLRAFDDPPREESASPSCHERTGDLQSVGRSVGRHREIAHDLPDVSFRVARVIRFVTITHAVLLPSRRLTAGIEQRGPRLNDIPRRLGLRLDDITRSAIRIRNDRLRRCTGHDPSQEVIPHDDIGVESRGGRIDDLPLDPAAGVIIVGFARLDPAEGTSNRRPIRPSAPIGNGFGMRHLLSVRIVDRFRRCLRSGIARNRTDGSLSASRESNLAIISSVRIRYGRTAQDLPRVCIPMNGRTLLRRHGNDTIRLTAE